MATRISAMLCQAIFVAFLIRACVIAEEATPRIIIIGSGAAGIAAASRLLQNGFHNVTILEAENRIGGRIQTTKFGDYWVDIGGQWIHGEEKNVAFELAWPLGLVEKSNTSWSSELFDSSGSSMPKEVANDFMGFYFNLTDNATPDEYMDKSIGEYLKFKIHEYFMEHPDIEEEKREPLENMLNLFQMAHDAGDNWHNVSAKGLREYFRCAGDLGINWKDRGYSTILDILMKKIPNPSEELPIFEKTIFNAEVSQINYDSLQGGVRVVTSNGNEYFGEHVIVTISLGVLKADHRTLFNPPLPQSKINAIEGLAFGTVAKIYLFFPEPWWDTENGTDMFAFHWSKRDRNEIENNPEKSWMLGVFNVMRIEHKPRLLCCWLAGPNARKMEIVPEERVFNQTKELLNRFLGKTYNITEPTAILRSKWFSNKHFRGTYSYRSLATEKSGAMAIHLANPITQENPVLLFAGEATSPHYYSTVHGAIGSGWREADRLINYYDNRKSASSESKNLRNSSQ